MLYQDLLFKKLANGWLYRSTSPWLFGPSKHYLLDDHQKQQVAAILLTANPIRRGLRLGLYFGLLMVVWVFAVAGAIWGLGIDLDHASPAQIAGFIVVVLLPMIVGALVVGVIRYWRVRAIIEHAPITDQRITLADVQTAQKGAAPVYSRTQALGLAAMAGTTAVMLLHTIVDRGGLVDVATWFSLVGAVCCVPSTFSFLLLASRAKAKQAGATD